MSSCKKFDFTGNIFIPQLDYPLLQSILKAFSLVKLKVQFDSDGL